MPDPTVSIITPAFNAEKLVQATIDSVLSQSFSDWEMLVVDDFSRDATCQVVERAGSRDSRVRLLRHTVNQGPAAARDTAVQVARGRFIAFLDSDDLWLPGKLERQLAFMSANAAPLSFTQFRRMSAAGDVVGRLIPVPDTLTYEDLLKNTAIATSTVIVDREKVGPFRMPRTYYDDYALWLQLLRPGHVARGLPEDLMRYRVMNRSVSRNKLRSAAMVWEVYRNVERLSIPRSLWCFANYATRGAFKYRVF